MFTPEFDPYSSAGQYGSNLSDQNTQQVTEVLNSVKTGILQYIGLLESNNQTDQVTSSSLGQSDSPLNINLNISPNSNSTKQQKSAFTNTDVSEEMLSIMDKYGVAASNSSGGNAKQLYNKTNLENELSQSQGCALFNIDDYTSNRVGSCNCKLS